MDLLDAVCLVDRPAHIAGSKNFMDRGLPCAGIHLKINDLGSVHPKTGGIGALPCLPVKPCPPFHEGITPDDHINPSDYGLVKDITESIFMAGFRIDYEALLRPYIVRMASEYF